MAAHELDGVTVSYGREAALRDVHLSIEAGHVVAVLGLNGAGKSTLVATAAGLLTPDAGRVRVDGIDIRRHPVAARSRLGIAGQDIALYRSETLRANLRLFGALAGVRGRTLDAHVLDAAAAVGISDVLDRRADRCSAGQLRRAHVAAAIVHRPAVLLLDEPAAHLDVAGRQALQLLSGDLAAKGVAVCWCTNDPEEADAVATTVAVLDGGRLLARGAPRDLVQRLARPEVEITFAGHAPALRCGRAVDAGHSVVRVPVSAPEAAVAEASALVADHLHAVRSLRVIEPDLAAAFAAVTGHDSAPADGRLASADS